jgi:hypothetical protein
VLARRLVARGPDKWLQVGSATQLVKGHLCKISCVGFRRVLAGRVWDMGQTQVKWILWQPGLESAQRLINP